MGALMIAGTSSSAGKSLLCKGLLYYLAKKKVAAVPFKSQNMSLNSYVPEDGREMAYVQAMQARCSGQEPDWRMNPILIKPLSNRRSEVIVKGQPLGIEEVAGYYARRGLFLEAALECFDHLQSNFDAVVVEGAGALIEPNLIEKDVANVPVALERQVPVVVVADVERGGSAASLEGLVSMAADIEGLRLEGFLLNKFRGDPDFAKDLGPVIERRTGLKYLGTLPYLNELPLGSEDSLSNPNHLKNAGSQANNSLLVSAVAYPHLANANDLEPLARENGVCLALTTEPAIVARSDLIILPGSRVTVADLAWMRERGLDEAIKEALARGAYVLGICGGLEMLCESIEDGIETPEPFSEGLSLLPAKVRFVREKVLARRRAKHLGSGSFVDGYEIHRGIVEPAGLIEPIFELEGGGFEGARCGRVLGTMMHGLFDSDSFRAAILSEVSWARGRKTGPFIDIEQLRTNALEGLCRQMERYLDMERLLELFR